METTDFFNDPINVYSKTDDYENLSRLIKMGELNNDISVSLATFLHSHLNFENSNINEPIIASDIHKFLWERAYLDEVEERNDENIHSGFESGYIKFIEKVPEIFQRLLGENDFEKLLIINNVLAAARLSETYKNANPINAELFLANQPKHILQPIIILTPEQEKLKEQFLKCLDNINLSGKGMGIQYLLSKEIANGNSHFTSRNSYGRNTEYEILFSTNNDGEGKISYKAKNARTGHKAEFPQQGIMPTLEETTKLLKGRNILIAVNKMKGPQKYVWVGCDTGLREEYGDLGDKIKSNLQTTIEISSAENLKIPTYFKGYKFNKIDIFRLEKGYLIDIPAFDFKTGNKIDIIGLSVDIRRSDDRGKMMVGFDIIETHKTDNFLSKDELKNLIEIDKASEIQDSKNSNIPYYFTDREKEFIIEIRKNIANHNDELITNNQETINYFDKLLTNDLPSLKEFINQMQNDTASLLDSGKKVMEMFISQAIIVQELKETNQIDKIEYLSDLVANTKPQVTVKQIESNFTLNQEILKSQFMASLNFLGFDSSAYELNITKAISEKRQSFKTIYNEVIKGSNNNIQFEIEFSLNKEGQGKILYKAVHEGNGYKVSWPQQDIMPNKQVTESLLSGKHILTTVCDDKGKKVKAWIAIDDNNPPLTAAQANSLFDPSNLCLQINSAKNQVIPTQYNGYVFSKNEILKLENGKDLNVITINPKTGELVKVEGLKVEFKSKPGEPTKISLKHFDEIHTGEFIPLNKIIKMKIEKSKDDTIDEVVISKKKKYLFF